MTGASIPSESIWAFDFQPLNEQVSIAKLKDGVSASAILTGLSTAADPDEPEALGSEKDQSRYE